MASHQANPVRVCVPVCVERARELQPAIARAAEIADIVELRLDCLPESELAVARRDISAALATRPRPIILTLRPKEFGGRRPISVAERLKFRQVWPIGGEKQEPDFWDLESDLAFLLQRREKEDPIIPNFEFSDWRRSICSCHDFAGIPSDIDRIYEQMASTPARILKIAVQANDVTDCLPVFRLLQRARAAGREIIAIAMGQAGIATRILGPSRGAFLTYGALDQESATAPGQITARELREVYRIDRINRHTEINGLMGLPAAHSISPHIHNAAFAAAAVDAVYIAFEVRDAAAFIRRMVHPRTREIDWMLRGLSVTAPHKSAVMPQLDCIEPAAKAIGAVNTIVVQNHELHGYNTDAEAFIKALRRRFAPLDGCRCAIIGAGGAARAVLWALRREGARVRLFTRSLETAKPLAERFQIDCQALEKARFNGFDVVINTTPLGSRGRDENETPAVADQLRGVRLVYDLVYNPAETRLMREAGAAGCETIGGLEMLLAQAAAQFKLWTGQEPNVEVMEAAAKTHSPFDI